MLSHSQLVQAQPENPLLLSQPSDSETTDVVESSPVELAFGDSRSTELAAKEAKPTSALAETVNDPPTSSSLDEAPMTSVDLQAPAAPTSETAVSVASVATSGVTLPSGLAVAWDDAPAATEIALSPTGNSVDSSDRSNENPAIAQVPMPLVTPVNAGTSPGFPPVVVANTPTGPLAGAPVNWSAYATPPFPQVDPAAGAVPTTGGTWVMVWIPYGMPTAPVVAPGSTASALPPNAYPSAYYPAWMPATVPQGIPAPATATPGMIPWDPAGGAANAAYPYPVAQPTGGAVPGAVPIVALPQPYLAQPQSPWPGGVPSQPAQSYFPSSAPIAAPAVTQPLPVPTAPTGTGSIPTLPSPPPATTPVVPFNSYPRVTPAVPTYPSGSFPAPLSVSNQTVGSTSTAATSLALEESREPLTDPNLDLQALYILQGDNSSARARLTGSAFLTRYLMVGGALDLVTGPDLTNDDGVQLTELYLATAFPGAPALRFRFGQLDLTSYFDRNSFAKDASRDFFNSTFQTNPALIAGANVTASRPAALVQWNVTDDIAFSSAVFSSDPDIADFALNGFAAEASFRTGDLIVRGTFISSEDSEFQGTGDRLESYGVNAEWFIPNLNIGLFGRYGELINADNDFDADTYSFGINAFDVFMDDDRLGLAYGRNLEMDFDDDTNPDVLELFYDFELLPNIRTAFSIQQRDSFSETYAGFRIRTELDLIPSLFAN